MTAGGRALTANMRWYIARQTAYTFAVTFAIFLWLVKVMVLHYLPLVKESAAIEARRRERLRSFSKP